MKAFLENNFKIIVVVLLAIIIFVNLFLISSVNFTIGILISIEPKITVMDGRIGDIEDVVNNR